jgi:succinylglutamate desuccinylase
VRKTLFIAATHGNEAYSIPVLKDIEQAFPKDEYGYDWVVGNPRAVATGTRYTEIDMNRNAPGEAAGEHYEERRAAELVRIAKGYDVVVDIHGSSSSCGPTTITPLPTYDNLVLASNFGLDANIVWYSQNSVVRGPIAQHMPVPAIELEFGPKHDPQMADALYETLARYLTLNQKEDLGSSALKGAIFYDVYGKFYETDREDVKDFMRYTDGDEEFYPYMTNVYSGIKCYKTAKRNIEEIEDEYRQLWGKE